MFRLRPETIALAALAVSSCTTTSTLKDLERTLADNESATAALGQWCRQRGLAQPPVIRALADRQEVAFPSTEIRQRLGVSVDESIGYRHVRLVCGDRVLSIAHNWYVPARLTADMNRTLNTSDVPFGRVVAPLGFHRDRIAQEQGAMPQCPADTILSHKAVLRTPDGKPFSLVVECYTPGNL
jgi:chorismate-pyruvate lyase